MRKYDIVPAVHIMGSALYSTRKYKRSQCGVVLSALCLDNDDHCTLIIKVQCSKLRLHPAPNVHNFTAGCTHSDTCAPGECTLFQNISIHFIGLWAQ